MGKCGDFEFYRFVIAKRLKRESNAKIPVIARLAKGKA